MTLPSLIWGIIWTPTFSPGEHGLSTDRKVQAGQTQSILEQGSQEKTRARDVSVERALTRSLPQGEGQLYAALLSDLGSSLSLSGPVFHFDWKTLNSLRALTG